MIFKRGNTYLGINYHWGIIPHRFLKLQAKALADLFSLWRDPPTHYAMGGKSIDLDTVEWMAI